MVVHLRQKPNFFWYNLHSGHLRVVQMERLSASSACLYSAFLAIRRPLNTSLFYTVELHLNNLKKEEKSLLIGVINRKCG